MFKSKKPNGAWNLIKLQLLPISLDFFSFYCKIFPPVLKNEWAKMTWAFNMYNIFKMAAKSADFPFFFRPEPGGVGWSWLVSAVAAGGAGPLAQPVDCPAATWPGPGAQPPEAHPPRQQDLGHVRPLPLR